MPDERQDSIRQGISAPEESPTGQQAAEERRRRAAESPPIGGAMGGTSDADSPAEESRFNAQKSEFGRDEDSEEEGDDDGRHPMYRDLPQDRVGG